MQLTAPGCLWQLMMIGDTTVGKTSLLVRYADDDFNESVLATIGIDFKIKVLLRPPLAALPGLCPLPAAHLRHPLARRLSTSMARRSSCRFGTPPARCVAAGPPPRARSVPPCGPRAGPRLCVASLTQARPLHGRSASARSRKLTTAAPWASSSFTCAGPFESGGGPRNIHPRAAAQPREPPGAGCDEHQDVEQYSQLGPQHRGQRTADREQNPHR